MGVKADAVSVSDSDWLEIVGGSGSARYGCLSSAPTKDFQGRGFADREMYWRSVQTLALLSTISLS